MRKDYDEPIRWDGWGFRNPAACFETLPSSRGRVSKHATETTGRVTPNVPVEPVEPPDEAVPVLHTSFVVAEQKFTRHCPLRYRYVMPNLLQDAFSLFEVCKCGLSNVLSMIRITAQYLNWVYVP